jgi:hypothetical protein
MTKVIKEAKGPVDLWGWQKDVIAHIEEHEDRRDSEAFQGMPDFTLNKALGITIAFPRGTGHTFLANYIASQYPTLLVYSKMDHYKEVTGHFPLNPLTETISLYEIFFSMYSNNNQHASTDLVDVRKKFDDKKVVVIDKGLSVSDDVKNFIYNSARGIVVILGH